MANKYRAFFIFFIVLAIVTSVIIGVLPFILESSLFNKLTSLSKPHSDNSDLWGKFPGRLQTLLTHSFRFFDYKSGDNLTLSSQKIEFEEKVDYTEIQFDAKADQINFIARKSFEKKVPNEEEEKVTLPSMGLFETLETLSNPPLYQKGINGIEFLKRIFVTDAKSFIVKLFTIFAFDNLMTSEDRVKKTILQKVEEAKKDLVWKHEKYGLSSKKGFYFWSKLINDQSLINQATWLSGELQLTSTEVSSIIGTSSFLYRYYTYFNEKIARDLKCDQQNVCGNEILYMQLAERKPTLYVGVENFAKLDEIVETAPLKFDSSPEIEIAFLSSKFKNDTTEYKDVSMSATQLKGLFDHNYSTSSIDVAGNAINLLNMNMTNDLYQAYTLYKISSSFQMNFLTYYIFEFLPDTFIYQKFTDNSKDYHISPTAKAFSSLAQIIIDETYGSLYSNGNLYSIILAKLTYQYIQDEKMENFCPIIMQRALDDGRKVMKICADKELNLGTYDSVKYWTKPYKCMTDPTLVCDTSVIEKLKKLAKVSDEDIKNLYSEDSLGKYLIKADKAMDTAYGCGGSCSSEFLAKRQYTESYITQNPPEGIEKSKTISDWDSTEFPSPIEIYYYEDKAGCGQDNCNEKSNGVLMSLFNSTTNIFTNQEAMANKKLLEEIFTLMMNGVTSSDLSKQINVADSSKYFGVLNTVLQTSIFNNTILTEYSPINVLLGSKEEDAGYLKILSYGGYYDNFKPNKPSTTGFTLYQEQKGNDDLSMFDKYTIQTTQNDNSQILRRIVEMNGVNILNTKKEEYTPVTGGYSLVNAPLYQFASLTNVTWLSDGFQFGADSLNSIYYYDQLSSRILEFTYNSKRSYEGITCYQYLLNENNISQGLNETSDMSTNANLDARFGLASQRFNKPFAVSSINNEFSHPIKETTVDADTNFICVDFFSNMVLESNLTLVYSLYTKEFEYLNSQLKKNETYPVILYNRYYKVNATSYNEIFEGVSGYNTGRIVLIVIGCIAIAAFVALGLYFFFKHSKEVDEPNIGENVKNQPLVIDNNNMDENNA